MTNGLMNSSVETATFEFGYAQRVVVATMILIASVVGTTGNSLVILSVLLSRRLRTATNAFVVNLSVADLLTSIVIPWHSVALLSKEGLPFAEWVCAVVAIVVFTAVGCSICTLACISLNRLLLITRPDTTQLVTFTPRKIAVSVALTWTIPLLIIVLPLLCDVGAVGYNKQLHFCGPNISHPRAEAYDYIIAGTLYPIPSATIVICYLLIWKHLRRHSKRMLSSPEETAGSSAGNLSPAPKSLAHTDSTATLDRSRLNRRQDEVTKNMFYVVCAFMLCLTPYAICLVIENSEPALPYAAVIVFINSCVNPMIYARRHRDFQNVFSCIFRRKWDHIPEPSNFLRALRRLNCRTRSRLPSAS